MRNVLKPSRMYQHDHNSINYNIFPNNVWRGLNNPDVPSLSCLFSLSLSLSPSLALWRACLFDQAFGVGAQGFERVCCVFWQMEGLTEGWLVPTGCSEEKKTY